MKTTPGTSVTQLPLPPPPPSLLSSGSTSEASAVTEDLLPFLRRSAGGDSPATARIQPGCFFIPPFLPPPLGLEAREAPQPLEAEGNEEDGEEGETVEEEEATALSVLARLRLAASFFPPSTRAHAHADAVTSPLDPRAAAAMAPSVADAAAEEAELSPLLLLLKSS